MKSDKSDALRAVIDTNVIISALLFPARRTATLLSLAQTGRYRLLTSPTLLREQARILRYRFLWTDEAIRTHLKDITHIGEIITPTEVLAILERDPDDNMVLACAVFGKANLIVSGDKDLLHLKVYEGIAIIRPRDFLRTFGLV